MRILNTRLGRLWTGCYTLTDTVTGEETVECYGWSTRWALDGIHSYQWRWVQRFGAQPCGCTLNPLTRRQVLYAGRCRQHGRFHRILDGVEDDAAAVPMIPVEETDDEAW